MLNYFEIIQALEMVVVALKKQKPMEITTFMPHSWACPRCAGSIERRDKYCKHCGQKLEG